MKKELVCINCPIGCRLTAELEDGAVISVSGNGCARGDAYARSEVTHPTRIVTALVRVKDRETPLSVKTAKAIPKELVFDALRALENVCVEPPVGIGDVVLGDVCGTGVDFVATREEK